MAKAKKATINGVSIEPKEKTIEMGKKIVEFRYRRGGGDQESGQVSMKVVKWVKVIKKRYFMIHVHHAYP